MDRHFELAEVVKRQEILVMLTNILIKKLVKVTSKKITNKITKVTINFSIGQLQCILASYLINTHSVGEELYGRTDPNYRKSSL